LGYGSIPQTRIAEGIAKIAAAIKAETGLTAGSSLDLSALKP
jgi:hypothetical protein